MKAKLRVLLAIERAINFVTKPLRLRVLLVPDSSLHHAKVNFRTDGLITSHYVNFLDDQRFRDVLAKIRGQISHSTYHEFRVYIALELAARVKEVPGMIVECGVGEGAFAMAVLEYTGYKGPMLLVDTFSGIDPTLLAKAEYEKTGLSAEEYSKGIVARSYASNSFQEISARLSAYRNVSLLKGSCPYVVRDNIERFNNITLLHIDMNAAMPEAETLKLLYDRTAAPGFILFDDYGFVGLAEQRKAVDGACKALGIDKPMTLPTGQGLIVKTSHRAHVTPCTTRKSEACSYS